MDFGFENRTGPAGSRIGALPDSVWCVKPEICKPLENRRTGREPGGWTGPKSGRQGTLIPNHPIPPAAAGRRLLCGRRRPLHASPFHKSRLLVSPSHSRIGATATAAVQGQSFSSVVFPGSSRRLRLFVVRRVAFAGSSRHRRPFVTSVFKPFGLRSVVPRLALACSIVNANFY
ncbi:hypothetical protein PIB30_012966 [Stylosanthes scabra]|uniref:Uncharacterized protein n=1 Tax=Stylosanthes scabra TaxID=79078 RepID=A0ABU6Z3Y1_9FABA|nr:hypothetical protein [Stylosanthes scabra]